MKFSLLIANYNNGSFFEDCYKSLIVQTYIDWEAVIVDDASTDNSVEIISQLIKDDNRFRLYINDKNYGCGYTKHKCVELATASCCGFVDPDDALIPEALTIMYKAWQQNTDAVLLHAQLFFCNEKLEKQSVYKGAAVVDTIDRMFFNLNGAVSHFAVFSKVAYNTTTGIDTYMLRAADQDLYIKMAEAGRFHFIEQPLYLYRRNANGISTNANVAKAHYWHWYAAMQGARRRGINLEEEFLNSFVTKKEYDNLQHIIEKSGVYKLSKWLTPILKFKSR